MFFFDLLIEENGSVPTVYFHHSEPDMQYALKQPFTSIGSDGTAISPDGPRGGTIPHPRSYGTFPRVLGRYVRELHTITLEDAVHKMTSANAEKINIPDRGRIKVGLGGGHHVFRSGYGGGRATFTQPHQYAVGIPYVIVNGQVVLDNGKHTGPCRGRFCGVPAIVATSAQVQTNMFRHVLLTAAMAALISGCRVWNRRHRFNRVYRARRGV